MANITYITDLGEPGLEIFSGLSEPQLRHWFEPDEGLFIAESPRVIERALSAGYFPHALLVDKSHIDGEAAQVISMCGDIPVYAGENSLLKQITGFNLARGAQCAMRRRTLPSAEKLIQGVSRVAVLENVVNPTNVGAIFRSAAALGIEAVLLTEACSDPLYRRAARVSMGTVFQVPWTYIGTAVQGLDMLRSHGFVSAAMALREDALSIGDERLKKAERLAVVLGTEGEGLLPETISACDHTVIIPMAAGVDSLNVAAASAVAFWELRDRDKTE
jgi:tRNA G18 (ribose-2'-O)-methylase SpoU